MTTHITGVIVASRDDRIPKRIKGIKIDPSTPHEASASCWCHPYYLNGSWHHKSISTVLDEIFRETPQHEMEDIFMDETGRDR